MAATRPILAAVLRWLASLATAAGLAAALVCWAPGTGIDESELDAGQSASAVEQLRRDRARDASVWHVYASFWSGLLSGDLGHSHAFNRPVRELLAERLPVTAAVVAGGIALAWAAGLFAAMAGLHGRRFRLAPVALTGVLASIPSAVLALACAVWGWPAAVALAAAVVPKVFTYCDQILQRALAQPYRLMALARGVPAGRILWAHVLRPSWPELRALAGVTLPVAIGAAIPVEVFTDTPGLGQLAWKAATGRDVTLLMYLTVLLTGLTLLANRSVEREARRAG